MIILFKKLAVDGHILAKYGEKYIELAFLSHFLCSLPSLFLKIKELQKEKVTSWAQAYSYHINQYIVGPRQDMVFQILQNFFMPVLRCTCRSIYPLTS